MAVSPGYRARGDGTPVYIGDQPRFTFPALTLNAAHPVTLHRSAVPLPGEPRSGPRALEANLALHSGPRFTIGKFAERAPSDNVDQIDAMQFVRLMHREDDSLLVASANSAAKQNFARGGGGGGGPARESAVHPHYGEPYLRHMSRKKDSPGKGLWVFEFEDVTSGGPLVHYVEQINLLALLCFDRSYNAILGDCSRAIAGGRCASSTGCSRARTRPCRS